MQLIERVKEKISKESMSVLTLSKETGIPAYRIYKWIDGKGNPKSEDTGKLEEWLNASLDKVQNGEAKKGSNPNEAAYLAGKLETKEEVIAEKEKRIQEIEARRLDALALAEKMESHYNDMKAIVEKNLNIIITNLGQNQENLLDLMQQTNVVGQLLAEQKAERVGVTLHQKKAAKKV